MTDHAPLADEERQRLLVWGDRALAERLIADLRASRAEVERLRAEVERLRAERSAANRMPNPAEILAELRGPLGRREYRVDL